MNRSPSKLRFPRNRFVGAMAAFVALTPLVLATDYTWDGTSNFWNSTHWLPGPIVGPTLSTDTATINSGVVTFSVNDSFGNAGTAASPQITINNGGTLASGGKFNTMWNLAINGGTLLANGGVNSPYGAFGLKGTVTIGGTSVSTIAAGGVNGFETISLGNGANSFTTFNVADATSSTAADLIVNAPLNANSGSANIGLIKTGAGTMRLTATNTYSGATQVREGTLEISGGTIPGPGLIDIGSAGVTQADFNLVSGSVTAGGQFVVGAHGSNSTVSHTAGSLQVNGTIYLGGYAEGPGTGTYTQNGGTVTTTGGINYGGGGQNNGVYNLNGGTLTTPTIVKNGGGTANFNFNGGTLTASANSTTFLQGLTAATVQAGGGTINSNGFNITISQTLLDGGGGITKSGAGILTLTSTASTFTGNLLVNGGSILAIGSSNTATPTATVLGNMTTPGRTITLSPGTSLTFGAHDTLGSTTSTPAAIILNNATMSHGAFFTTVGNITLNDSSTLTGANGANANFHSFNLRGSLTVSGTGGSFINTTGTSFTGVHLGVNGPNDFIVNSTGAAADLTVAVPLLDRPGNNVGAGQLRKTGAGTMVLTAANTYTGSTLVNEGTLEVNGGSISGPGLIDIGSVGISQANFKLTAGSVTAGSQFVVGAHGSNSTMTHTAGTLQVNGTMYLGGYSEGTGTGTYVQNGGTVTTTAGINFGGGGPNSGVYNFNGGTLTTTVISKSGAGTGNFNFNGGTLTASANSAVFINGLTAATVQSGGGTINSNGFNITIPQALLNGGGGITKTGAGTLTLSNNTNAFAGNLTINAGTVAATAGLLNNAPTASALGSVTTPGRQLIVNSGGILEFRQHDVLGNDGAPVSNLSLIINGGTVLAVPGGQSGGNGPFNILPSITLSGGTLTSANGAFSPVQSFSLKGDVTVNGSMPSIINTTGTPALFNGIHLSKAGGVTFDVQDVTSDASTDLSVSAPLIDRAQGGAGGLTKSGAGTMALNQPATYTGATNLTGGTLLLGATNALPSSSALNLSTGVTLNTGGFSVTTGALAVNGVANIDTAAGLSTLNFASVSSWSAMLNIWNYTGGIWAPGSDKITFTNVAGIDLNNVNFYSGAVGDTGSLIGSGGGLIGNELVPVPESGAFAVGLVLLGAIARQERRRRHCRG